jgi:hypothetical protein
VNEVTIYLKSGQVLKLTGDKLTMTGLMNSMSTDKGSAVMLGDEGFIMCSEIAAAFKDE